jgi:hypothetical protein
LYGGAPPSDPVIGSSRVYEVRSTVENGRVHSLIMPKE